MARVSAAALAAVVALTLAGPATAQNVPANDREVIDTLPDTAYADSITELNPNISALNANISPLEQVTSQGAETVVSLSSDILFEFGKAEVADTAAARIRELAADVPQNATVQVTGHTDSIGEDDFNQELSQERAATVAQIIEEDRPDLTLDVEGLGETDPVEPNEKDGEDNPGGRAANRRVEIRYDG